MTNRFTFAKFRRVIRGRASLALCLALCCPALGLSQGAHAATFITIDAPGAGTDRGLGTWAQSINRAGAITGGFFGSDRVDHGFLRTPDGTITTFDVPGACKSNAGTFGTLAQSINPVGAITGWYCFADASADRDFQGFVRAPNGTITTFHSRTEFTQPLSINPTGWITGYFYDEQGMAHGFLRGPHGAMIKFDAPGAGAGQGTFPQSINLAREIAGVFWDAAGVAHGFLRIP